MRGRGSPVGRARRACRPRARAGAMGEGRKKGGRAMGGSAGGRPARPLPLALPHSFHFCCCRRACTHHHPSITMSTLSFRSAVANTTALTVRRKRVAGRGVSRARGERERERQERVGLSSLVARRRRPPPAHARPARGAPLGWLRAASPPGQALAWPGWTPQELTCAAFIPRSPPRPPKTQHRRRRRRACVCGGPTLSPTHASLPALSPHHSPHRPPRGRARPRGGPFWSRPGWRCVAFCWA